MINSVNPNRIAIIAGLALIGQGLVATAGVLQLRINGVNTADVSLITAGVLGFYAYCILMLMGRSSFLKKAKGGAKPKVGIMTKIFKPLMVWKYPLDTSFLLLTLMGFGYYIAGLSSANPALILLACLVMTAACLAWFWPENKLISGYNAAHVCTMIFLIASLCYFAAGFLGHNYFLIGAGGFAFLAHMISLAPSKASAEVPAAPAEDEEDKEEEKAPPPSAPSKKRR